MASCLSFSWLISQDDSATDLLHSIAMLLIYFARGLQLALSQLSHFLKNQYTNNTIEKHSGHLRKHFACGTCPLQFRQCLHSLNRAVSTHSLMFSRLRTWCKCDLIQWLLVMRHPSHRYELVWTNTLLFAWKYLHAAHKCFATISRGPWVYKNGITYENQKNVTTSDLQDHNVGAGI